MVMARRIQLRRSKGWHKPDNTVVVARPTKWGNPFTIESAKDAGFREPRETAVRAFRDWLQGDPWACGCLDDYDDKRQAILDALGELRGKNLACWCPVGCPCHADVLLEMANS